MTEKVIIESAPGEFVETFESAVTSTAARVTYTSVEEDAKEFENPSDLLTECDAFLRQPLGENKGTETHPKTKIKAHH